MNPALDRRVAALPSGNWEAVVEKWFNRDRLHAELGYLTPFEMEIKYVREQGLPRQAA
jgi:hypothetical protein